MAETCEVKCPHCHEPVPAGPAGDGTYVRISTHDWPKPCRQVCPGSRRLTRPDAAAEAADCAAEVAALPRRTAHALHALIARRRQEDGGFLLAAEVMEYDYDALTVQATAAGLTHARRLSLATNAGYYWFPTSRGLALQRALEDRVLAEQDAGG